MTICSPEEASPEGNIACEGEQIIFIYRHRPMTLAEANGMVSLRGALHVPSLEIREHFLF